VFIPLARRGEGAFTASELLITLGVVFLLGIIASALFLQKKRMQAAQTCVMNLKVVTLACKMWPSGSDQLFPWQHHNLGSSAFTNSGLVLPHYLTLTNYINSPKYLTCPSDSRRSAANWNTLNDSNISYFINFDGEEVRPSQVAFGDRMFTSTIPPTNNLLILTPQSIYLWDKRIHGGLGNISFTDGSVRRTTDQELEVVFHSKDNTGARIQLPR
jgi:prepilin-type processing-associated H-X9-DG protein